MTRVGTKLVVIVVLGATAGEAWGLSPEDKCESYKNKIAGKYAYCRQNAEAKAIKRGAVPDYSRCDDFLLDKWARAEQRAIGHGATCVDSVTDTAIQSFVTLYTNDVAVALDGGALPDCSGDLAICNADLATCNDDFSTCGADLGSCNSDLSTCQSDLTQTQSDLTTCDGTLTTCNGDLSTCNGDLSTCQSDLTQTQSDLTTCDGNLTSCNGDLSTCNGDLSTCQSDLTQTQSDLTTCGGDLTTCNGDLSTCSGDLSTCQSDLTQTQSDLTQTQSDLGQAQSDLTTCEGDLTTCENDLTACENDLGLCGNGVIDGGEECDQGDLDGETCSSLGFVGGILACGAGCSGFDTSGCYAERFVDNADGTITDNVTGLMWEKKVALGGGANFSNPHNADNAYRWAGTCSIVTTKRCQPTAAAAALCAAKVEGGAGSTTGCDECTGAEGTCTNAPTAWTLVADLNAAAFAGKTDWRLPKVAELVPLVDYWDADATNPWTYVAFDGASCGGACTDITSAACSCTAGPYWSASMFAPSPQYAWYVTFAGGFVDFTDKGVTSRVRAVRDAP